MQTAPAQQLIDHLFRHEAGKMIAVLTRIFGMHNIEMAEDVVQEAFLKAIHAWKFEIPANPAAWLMQTARNKAIDIVRRQQHYNQYSKEVAAQLRAETEHTIEQFFSDEEINDSQLRMIFTCCHPALKQEDRIALTLKTVSGFGVAEIARALVTNDAAIQKRLYRAKQFIKEHDIQFEIPAGQELMHRLDTVYTILYLLFNEGYNSIKADELIRRDLCGEAMRLANILSQNKAGKQPATYALLSLMCLQASRFDSRLDEENSIILLQHQDRNKWNRELIKLGYLFLNKSSKGNYLSVYHIESAIAAEHCLAASFSDTNWKRMLELYDLLLTMKATPVVALNRAVILSQSGETKRAIDEVLAIENIEALLESQHIYSAVLGDLFLTLRNYEQAKKYLSLSLHLTPSEPEKKLLNDKLKTIPGAIT
ncbi:MAG TPA: sigma-70 family RNA polymerase sigma factor [Chitinophagaceae bacterium]|nr:sigma-70 family RNA polymerase sigma factor [Chitinophagaceae bacterium]